MVFNDVTFNKIFELVKKVFKLIDEEKFSELRNYETDELLNRQISEMEFYKRLGQRLHFDKVLCYPSRGSDTQFDETTGIYKVEIKVSYEKYVTNEAGEVIDGVRDYIVESYYDISIFERDNSKTDNIHCDYCGAPVGLDSNRCEYCGSIKDRTKSGFIICDIVEKAGEDLQAKLRRERNKQSGEAWDNLLKDLEKQAERNNFGLKF